jgi:hypothetical protein
MQAYQSFNPQAYNAAAAAAVSAAAYYHHHHHPANYVISPQYPLDGFAYNPTVNGSSQNSFNSATVFQHDYSASNQYATPQPQQLSNSALIAQPPTYLTMNTTQNNIYTNVCYNTTPAGQVQQMGSAGAYGATPFTNSPLLSNANQSPTSSASPNNDISPNSTSKTPISTQTYQLNPTIGKLNGRQS